MRILSGLCLLALLGTGCFPKSEALSVPSPTPSVGLVYKTEKAYNKDTLDADPSTSSGPGGTGACEFEREYPVLEAQAGLSEEARLRINTEIAQASLQPMGLSDATSSFENLDDAMADFNDTCIASLRSIQEEMGDPSVNSGLREMGPSMDWYDALGFSVPMNQDGLFSVNLSSETYTGGAHGNHFTRALVFDVKSGQRLRLGDIIEGDKLQSFFKKEAQALLDLNREEDFLFQEAAEQFEILVKLDRPANEEELKASATFDGFYVTPESIVTQYNEYEIAPYSSGQPSVELSWKDIGEYVREDSVVKGLVK